MNEKPWNPQPLKCHYDIATGDLIAETMPEQLEVSTAFLQLADPDCVELTCKGLKFVFANKTLYYRFRGPTISFELLSDEEVKAHDPE
jgi:hypothetical protein